MTVRIDDLQFDEFNEEECARHYVSAREILQVLDDGDPVFLPNKKRHASPILMVGLTHGGRMLSVPLVETDMEAVWRPATAWDSDADEKGRYYRQRRK